MVKSSGFGVRHTWVRIPALLCTSCVTMSNLLVPQFPHLQNGIKVRLSHRCVEKTLWGSICKLSALVPTKFTAQLLIDFYQNIVVRRANKFLPLLFCAALVTSTNPTTAMLSLWQGKCQIMAFWQRSHCNRWKGRKAETPPNTMLSREEKNTQF